MTISKSCIFFNRSDLIIPGHIEIDGLAMAKFFTEFFANFDLTIKPKATKIEATWVQDGQEVQVQPWTKKRSWKV